MSGIALYNVLTKVGATPEEAEKAVADVASSKEVATKMDTAEIKGDIRELKGKIVAIQWVLGLLFVMNVAIFAKLFF